LRSMSSFFLRSCCSLYCLSINECLSMSPSLLKLGAFLRLL
jgi:hypothetical protein